MALVNGPLFSLEAHGQLGKALVYSSWKGRAYVREYQEPSNPRTLAQQFQRAVMAALSRWWAFLPAAVQDTWTLLASQGNYSEFNAFTSVNLDAKALGDFPSGSADGTGGARVGVPASPTMVGGINKITITHDPATAPAAQDLLLIGLSTAGGAAGTAQNIARIIASKTGSTDAGPTEFVVTDIPAGTYFTSAVYVGPNGIPGTWVNSAAAVVVTGQV